MGRAIYLDANEVPCPDCERVILTSKCLTCNNEGKVKEDVALELDRVRRKQAIQARKTPACTAL